MLRASNESISEYVSAKTAKKVLSKYCKAKLSARALEAINLFLDQIIVLLVKHRNTANKYGITHYQSILTKIIKDEMLLKSCIDEARSRSAQMITGLSLNYVMTVQEMVKTQDSLDRIQEDDPQHKIRYLSQLRQFIVSCSLLSSNQYSNTSNSRPGAHYFSLPVGLFIGNAIEQISRFILLKIGSAASAEKLKTISADRVAYIFFHDKTISDIACSTTFFSSFEVKTFKAIAIDDSNLPSIMNSESITTDPLQLLKTYAQSEWDVNSVSVISPNKNSFPKRTSTNSKSSPSDSESVGSLSNHLSTNLSLSKDRTNDFEQLFNSGKTIKLSLTPSRLRTTDEPKSPIFSPARPVTTRRRSLMSQTSTLFSKGNLKI